MAYSENLDFVIQHVFIEANFRAETQPFIRHRRRMRDKNEHTATTVQLLFKTVLDHLEYNMGECTSDSSIEITS